MTDRLRPYGPLVRIALLVAVGDWLTKSAAARFVAHEPTEWSAWLRFAVVHNDAALLGLSLGTYTWQLNLALTLAAIALVIPVTRELSRVDPLAPRALGLIAGGALGNLGSLVLTPRGVVDFIAVRMNADGWLVLNVADVAAYAGLALMVRTGFLIVAEMRRTARVAPLSTAQPVIPVVRFAAEREVPREVFADGGPADVIEADVVPIGEPMPRLPLATPPRPRHETRVLEFRRRTDDSVPRVDRPADASVPRREGTV